MRAAILLAAESHRVVPAEFAFQKGDLRAAGGADQSLLLAARIVGAGRLRHRGRLRPALRGGVRRAVCHRCLGLKELGERQQILGAMLTLEHLAPFDDGVQAAEIEHGREHHADAQAFVNELFAPATELVRLDDVPVSRPRFFWTRIWG